MSLGFRVRRFRFLVDFGLSGRNVKEAVGSKREPAEYGWHFKLIDDFVTEIGVSVSQDDFESLIGRLGVRAGFNFPNDRGTVYARASVLHDFKGEMSSRLDYAGKSRVVEDDLGGTWYEFGLGANFSLTPVPTFMSTLNASMRARWSKTGAATSASDTSSSRLALREPEGLPV